MRRTLLFVFPLLLVVICVNCVSAQFTPYFSNDGIPSATKVANDSLGSDAKLYSLFTTGNVDTTGLIQAFDPGSGQSSIWGYGFYSPAKQLGASVGVFDLFGTFQANGSIDSSFVLASGAVPLDLTGTYANSNKMAQALRADLDYQAHTQPRGDSIILVYLSSVPITATFPSNFPSDKPVWTILLSTNDSNSSFVCFVASSTGQTSCSTITGGTVSVPVEASERNTPTLTVTPNPASSITRVAITAPKHGTMAGVKIGLYDMAGRKALDLTGNFAQHQNTYVEFDAATLPPGTYYCRATGTNWSGTMGVVVQPR